MSGDDVLLIGISLFAFGYAALIAIATARMDDREHEEDERRRQRHGQYEQRTGRRWPGTVGKR